MTLLVYSFALFIFSFSVLNSCQSTSKKQVVSKRGMGQAAYLGENTSLRRMLAWQYKSSIKNLLGVELEDSTQLPEDTPISGFESIGSAQIAIAGENQVTLYENSEYAAAQSAMQSSSKLDILGCHPTSPSDRNCMKQFLETTMIKAYRRPVSQLEVEEILGAALNISTADGDFYSGAEFALSVILQMPDFIYFVELGESAPSGGFVLTDLEYATRISYFLAGHGPNQQLYQAAAQGKLSDEAELRHQIQTILNSPSGKTGIQKYFQENLGLKDLALYQEELSNRGEPNGNILASMIDETNALIENIIANPNFSYMDLFTSESNYRDERLAAHYDLTKSQAVRSGILGQGSFLTVTSHDNKTSPTLRGKFILNRFLCEFIPPPPPDIGSNLESIEGAKTAREKLKGHLISPNCAACHEIMDPIGLGLEKFDNFGKYREIENGEQIDSLVEIPSLGQFADPKKLGEILANDPRTSLCFLKNIFRFSSGREEGPAEIEILKNIDKSFRANGFNIDTALIEFILSDAYRFKSLKKEK